MRIKKNFLIYFFLVFIFLLYLKIDFRLIENITCCGDDFDYYTHAKTIAVDGDFDYSNNIVMIHIFISLKIQLLQRDLWCRNPFGTIFVTWKYFK